MDLTTIAVALISALPPMAMAVVALVKARRAGRENGVTRQRTRDLASSLSNLKRELSAAERTIDTLKEKVKQLEEQLEGLLREKRQLVRENLELHRKLKEQ